MEQEITGWKYNTVEEAEISMLEINTAFNINPPLTSVIINHANIDQNFFWFSQSPIINISSVLGDPETFTVNFEM